MHLDFPKCYKNSSEKKYKVNMDMINVWTRYYPFVFFFLINSSYILVHKIPQAFAMGDFLLVMVNFF